MADRTQGDAPAMAAAQGPVARRNGQRRRALALSRLSRDARSLWPVRLLPTTRSGALLVARLTDADHAAAASAYARAGGAPPRPLHADWVWRPAAWTSPVAPHHGPPPATGASLSADMCLFHDLPDPPDTIAQLDIAPTPGTGGPAPAGLGIAWQGLFGRFLSLAIDLPDAACAGLGPDHLLVAHLVLSLPPGTPAHLRLNIVSGPNTARKSALLRPPPGKDGPVAVAFDLTDAVPPRGVDRIWCDLILSHLPDSGSARITDLSLARRPRARV